MGSIFGGEGGLNHINLWQIATLSLNFPYGGHDSTLADGSHDPSANARINALESGKTAGVCSFVNIPTLLLRHDHPAILLLNSK